MLTWIDVFIKQDYQSYRMWAKSTGAGDIYILNGIPRVQILGTSIFVTLFICEFMKERRLTFYGALMAVTALRQEIGIRFGNICFCSVLLWSGTSEMD